MAGASVYGQNPPAIPNDGDMRQAEVILAQNPNNFDNYFTYAQMATARGDDKKAAEAYLHMLRIDPSLDRVRLDLSMSYARMGYYKEAITLMEQVLQRRIPDEVRHTIETVLADLKKSSNPSHWSAYITTGVNWDSNANSASDNDHILVLDTSVLLPPGDRKTDDLQAFVGGGISNKYRLTDPTNTQYTVLWESGAGLYQNEQNHLDNLNLRVYSFDTGPRLIIPEWQTEFKLNANYAHILLDGYSYLRQYTGELSTQTALNEKWRLQTAISHEFRDYLNAPQVTVYEDRTGPAEQARLGVAYSYSPVDLFDAGTTWRIEDTKQAYYDNKQGGVDVGYTRQFDETLYGRASAGFRKTLYKDNDPLLTTQRRVEWEKTLGYSLTKMFTDSFSLTLAYQYRDVDASFENYEYDNHRFGFNFLWQF
ncbi:MAG: surface lipoprotein assembly modifier [Rickettsiales bacterium]